MKPINLADKFSKLSYIIGVFDKDMTNKIYSASCCILGKQINFTIGHRVFALFVDNTMPHQPIYHQMKRDLNNGL